MADAIPDLLRLGGEEAFEAYRAEFDRLYRSGPIFDPRGWVIVFKEDACRHVCFHEERFDKRRKLVEGEATVRDTWNQDRAEHIPWILPAITAPSLIVLNNQVEGNQVYLLGFPRGDVNHPSRRYYVSVRPEGTKRAVFKTAYPIDQRVWDGAMRGRPGRQHVLYRERGRRW